MKWVSWFRFLLRFLVFIWYEMQISSVPPPLEICIHTTPSPPAFSVGLNRTETERPDRGSDSGKNGAIWDLKAERTNWSIQTHGIHCKSFNQTGGEGERGGRYNPAGLNIHFDFNKWVGLCLHFSIYSHWTSLDKHTCSCLDQTWSKPNFLQVAILFEIDQLCESLLLSKRIRSPTCLK